MLCPVCRSDNSPTAPVCAACGDSLHGQGLAHAFNSALPVGVTLQSGQYVLQGVLGQGGFGITYHGHDAGLNRAVAIKEFFHPGCIRARQVVLPFAPDSSRYATARTRFLEEARTLARFRHPGIVNVYTVFEENNTAYMVMEFLQGQTLLQLIEERGALTEPEAIALITKAGEALAAVHQGGLLHRDIKPENIVLRGDGQAVLIDFGTAREFLQDTTSQMTATVTPGYAPLEQYGQQARFGAFTDIYSLGATLYHLLTGRPPAQAPDRASGIELKEPRELNPDLSDAVNDAIVRALAVRVDERPQSVREFLDGLAGKRFTALARAVAPSAVKPLRDFSDPVLPPVFDLDEPGVDSLTDIELQGEMQAPPRNLSSHLERAPAPLQPLRRHWWVVALGVALLGSWWLLQPRNITVLPSVSPPDPHLSPLLP